jgi:hypothetical protein
MNLQECLDRLARGKLGNLSICSNGKIKEEHLQKVVDAINEGLTRLHTVLPLKEKSLIVEMTESRTEYPLTSEHSLRRETGSIYDSYDLYIRDTDFFPFEDDIINIIEVWDDLDRKRPINDPEHPLSVFTPEHNTLNVNYTSDLRVLNVIYRARHKLLTLENLTDTIELPTNLEGALISFVASVIHSDMNTETAVANSQKYYAEYQNIINEIIQNGTLNPDKLVLGRKFIGRGWV